MEEERRIRTHVLFELPDTAERADLARPAPRAHPAGGRRGLSRAAAFALALVLTACGDAPGHRAFEVSDSAGVVFTRNLGAAADTARPAAPAVRIGLTEGATEYLFEWISDVQPLPDGRVVVVDNRGARVALFDGDGRWIRDMGGPGDGPGEYRTPLHVWLTDGELWLWDVVPRRLNRYSPAGEFLGSEQLAWKRTGAPLRALNGGWVDEREWGQQMEPGPAGGALVRVAPTGDVLDTLVGPYPVPRVGWEVVDPATGRGQMVNPPVFSAAPVWTADGERLLWSPGAAGRVELRDPHGRLTRVIRLDREDRPVTDADRNAYLLAMQARFGIPDASLGRMREETVFADHRPAVTALVVDDGGRIWVADHDPAVFSREPGAEWDVLDAEGRMTHRVAFPRGFHLKRVLDGRAYGISTIEDGVHVVDVFEVTAQR